MDYYLITNARGKVAHVAGPHDKPLCKPDTKVNFHRTLLGRDNKLCESCSSKQMSAQWAARVDRHKTMTLAEQLADPS